MAVGNHTFESWIEEDSSNYTGNYLFVDFANYNKERYLCREIIITQENGSFKVLFQQYFNTDISEEFIKTEIHSPFIENNKLSASNWKTVFDTEIKGEFVCKYPPANAKGPNCAHDFPASLILNKDLRQGALIGELLHTLFKLL